MLHSGTDFARQGALATACTSEALWLPHVLDVARHKQTMSLPHLFTAVCIVQHDRLGRDGSQQGAIRRVCGRGRLHSVRRARRIVVSLLRCDWQSAIYALKVSVVQACALRGDQLKLQNDACACSGRRTHQSCVSAKRPAAR